jgi:hypothetical protein
MSTIAPLNHEYVESLEAIAKAVKKECKKFRFPDEDRPELYEALKAHEDRYGKVS